jgi:hypothetical protein
MSQWTFDAVNRIVVRHWQSRDIPVRSRPLTGQTPK